MAAGKNNRRPDKIQVHPVKVMLLLLMEVAPQEGLVLLLGLAAEAALWAHHQVSAAPPTPPVSVSPGAADAAVSSSGGIAAAEAADTCSTAMTDSSRAAVEQMAVVAGDMSSDSFATTGRSGGLMQRRSRNCSTRIAGSSKPSVAATLATQAQLTAVNGSKCSLRPSSSKITVSRGSSRTTRAAVAPSSTAAGTVTSRRSTSTDAPAGVSGLLNIQEVMGHFDSGHPY